MDVLGVVSSPRPFLYEEPGQRRSDQVLNGWPLRLGELWQGFVRAETFYGYQGWISREDLVVMDRQAFREWSSGKGLFQVKNQGAFLLRERDVTGEVLLRLPRDCFVRVLEEPDFTAGEGQDVGWRRVATAAGVQGFVASGSLGEVTVSFEYLLEERGGETSWFLREAHRRLAAMEGQEELRERICHTALSFLGTPYLWAGKSERGLDCSGLAFLSYMENGFLIYRDARIAQGFPIREIPRERLKRGDLVFFPGHVGIYLGEGRIVHATAHAPSPCVTVSRLGEWEGLREIQACGSIF